MTADLSLIFCTAMTATGAAGASDDSTDWVDMKAAMDVGGGDEIVVEILVDTTFAGVGGFVTFQLMTCDAAAGTPGVVIAETPAISVTALVAPVGSGAAAQPKMGGSRVLLRASPRGVLALGTDKALLVRALYSGATITAGAISAHVVPEAATSSRTNAYAAGF